MSTRKCDLTLKATVLSAVFLGSFLLSFGQVPNPTPRPAAPPGTERPNPAAPPATERPAPQAPPGAPTTPGVPQQPPPAPGEPVPGVTPQAPQTPTTQTPAPPAPTPEGEPVEEPREPNVPVQTAKPLPPLPNMSRLGVTSDNTLTLSLNDAIKKALENNNEIEVARDDVRFAETQLRALEGIFDPIFSITPQYDKRITPQQSILGGAGGTGAISTTTYTWSPSVFKQFGRGGGAYTLTFANSHTNTSNSFSIINPYYSSNLSLQYAQPLLRNRSIDNNRRQIRIQKKRLEQSDADFRQRTINVIALVQQAYWELVFALRDQQNQLANLNLSRENLKNVEAQIAAGAKAPLERAEVQTELANRESSLLIAVQNVSIAENNLKNLIVKDPQAPEWSAQITPTETPAFDTTPVNLNDALKEARDNRPELRRLRLQNDISAIDLKYFKNQMRPQIDLVGALATTGLAGSEVPLPPGSTTTVNPELIGGYAKDLSNLFNFKTRNVSVGVTISLPFKNTTAEANYAGARIQQEQLEASMRAQEQVIEVEVRNAAQAVETARRRVMAAREARTNAEMQLEGEQRLYQVGRSTTFLLFQRENALTNARGQELRAETDYNKALSDLQRATSTTLRTSNVIVETPVR